MLLGVTCPVGCWALWMLVGFTGSARSLSSSAVFGADDCDCEDVPPEGDSCFGQV